MSLVGPKNCKDSVMQYCNYGFDKSKYSSADDCRSKKLLECSDVTKKEANRDVLEGGFWNTLFPSYGGAGYRGLIRIVIFLVILFLIIKYAVPYIKNKLSA
jgi:hypothetical protein